MRIPRSIPLLLLSVLLFALSGCGSNNASTSFSPTTSSGSPVGVTGSNATFSNVSSAAGRIGISLGTDRTTIDANVGQVLATATITNSLGTGIAGKAVAFTVVSGPATVTPSLATVTTDSTGKAVTIVIPGNTLTTTNVIIKATTVINGQTAAVYATFQIVRGTGVIALPAIKTVSDTIAPNIAGTVFTQQMQVSVTDGNGNPRVGVPVTLSVYSQTGSSAVVIDFHAPTVTEPSQSTVTTDSKGQAIFNITIEVLAPTAGLTFGDSIVFRAVSNDTPPLTGYTGIIASVTKTLPPLTLIPGSASFLTGDVAGATRTFTVSGGVGPYTVNSSNSARVSVPSSTTGTVTATLVDASLWTEVVTITVSDQTGKTASATITRQ
jgi:hypothetical protein